MQLAEFVVAGLFDSTNHHITFPTSSEQEPSASVTILHGANGIGKTTILKMLDGLMKLDFTIFRQVPFSECSLAFNSGDRIVVRRQAQQTNRSLSVRFKSLEVRLHPEHSGALLDADIAAIEAFRKAFFAATESLKFEFIDTARIVGIFRRRDEEPDQVVYHRLATGEVVNAATRVQARRRAIDGPMPLATQVQQFAREALANYRHFFATSQPELFPKILESLSADTVLTPDPGELLFRLERVYKEDVDARRLGLAAENWDFKQLARFLEPGAVSTKQEHILTVLGTYIEALESRLAERQLVAERLRRFEQLMNGFFENKRVRVNARKGFEIITPSGQTLREDELSSGEYHLLYLMVTALVTQRRGSVIAIDEPEMSMHLKWQRQLLRALVECASNAQPQFIFATHSPDIAAEYPDFLISLSATGETVSAT